jgi:hypothetical protein
VREETKRLLREGFRPFPDSPTTEPSEVVLGMDAGKVKMEIGEGLLLFDPDQAEEMGKELIRLAHRCKSRISPLR